MRKFLTFIVLLLSSLLSFGQVTTQTVQTFTATSQAPFSMNVIGSGSQYWTFTWNITGTISACAIKLDSSTDGITWGNGDVIAAQTCTSNGNTTSSAHVVNYVRINPNSTITGTGSVIMNLSATNAPVSGGGSVSSVGMSVPSGLAVSGSPVTGAGTLNVTYSVAGADRIIVSTAANTASFSAVPNCGDSTHASSYSTTTHTWGCQAITVGGSSFPLTISGTVTSGGIPFFNSSTQESSSGVLSANTLIRGGGPGVAPSDSSITDDLSSISSSEPFSGGSFTSTAPCNTGTAGCFVFVGGSAPSGQSGTAIAYSNPGGTALLLNLNNTTPVTVVNTGNASTYTAGIQDFTGATATKVSTVAAGDNTTNSASTAFVTTAINNAIAAVNPAVAVEVASAAVLPNSPTYNNGVAGIGATLTTATTNTPLVVDGYTPILNDRILVKNQASAFQNGVYIITQVSGVALAWILTRALDYDQPSDMNNTGAIPVVNGTINTKTQWLQTSTVNTVGTDAVTFTQFSLNPSTIALTIASGTSALGTSAISSATCASVVTTSATGTVTTDPIEWGFNGDPTGVTGYVPATSGMLTIIAYPSSNNVNFKVCNNTTASITPGAITLNWRVAR